MKCKNCGHVFFKLENRFLTDHYGYDYCSIDCADKYLARPKFGQWVDATENLPNISEKVLVTQLDDFGCREIFIASVAGKSDVVKWYKPFKEVKMITHWMPLPPLPNSEPNPEECDATEVK